MRWEGPELVRKTESYNLGCWFMFSKIQFASFLLYSEPCVIHDVNSLEYNGWWSQTGGKKLLPTSSTCWRGAADPDADNLLTLGLGSAEVGTKCSASTAGKNDAPATAVPQERSLPTRKLFGRHRCRKCSCTICRRAAAACKPLRICEAEFPAWNTILTHLGLNSPREISLGYGWCDNHDAQCLCLDQWMGDSQHIKDHFRQANWFFACFCQVWRRTITTRPLGERKHGHVKACSHWACEAAARVAAGHTAGFCIAVDSTSNLAVSWIVYGIHAIGHSEEVLGKSVWSDHGSWAETSETWCCFHPQVFLLLHYVNLWVDEKERSIPPGWAVGQHFPRSGFTGVASCTDVNSVSGRWVGSRSETWGRLVKNWKNRS